MMHDYHLRKKSYVFSLAGLLVAVMASNAAAETLEQAWTIARDADHGLKASRDNSVAAANQLAAAKSARLPVLSMGANYFALTNLPELKADLLSQSFQIPLAQRNSVLYDATATLPIYTGGRIEHGIAAAVSSLKAAELNETANEQDLKLRVAEAYINVLRASRGLKVAESHVTSLEAHAHDVDNLFQQGMAAKSAQLSAQVALLDARQQFLQASNSLDLARAAYNHLLGRALDQPVMLDELSLEPTDDTLTVLTNRALDQRSELKVMDRQVAALRDQATAVRRETAPQVGLSGSYNYVQDRYLVHEDQWSVAVGIKWNVFDGGAARHRGSAVELQSSALFEQRDGLALAIGLQVRQAWLDVQETRKRISVTQSAIAQAEENLRVVRDRYVNGLTPHTEVLEAETLRVNSATNHANAVYDAVLASLRLKYAIGEL
jgi:outer membrane protein TolC